jgi:hypothetical protein
VNVAVEVGNGVQNLEVADDVVALRAKAGCWSIIE